MTFMKFEIKGGSLPVLICELEANESIETESGGMSWMSGNLLMSTNAKGGIGGAFGRMFSGESMFLNTYTAQGAPGMIAIASKFPGSILHFEISPENSIIIQKQAYLASSPGVEQAVHFNKKLGAGLFGGEGIIMQKLSGNGDAFVEIDGYAAEYELGPGESLIMETGRLAAMDATCSMDIQKVKGAKNVIFGGEGLFNTIVTGPGRVFVQSIPVSALAEKLIPFLPSSSSN